jgi:hypothetical protein
MDDLKERRGYSHLKEEALDRTMWTTRFGRCFGPVVRQTTKWMNEYYNFLCDCRVSPWCRRHLRSSGLLLNKQWNSAVLNNYLVCRPQRGSTWHSLQWARTKIFSGVRQLERETDQTHLHQWSRTLTSYASSGGGEWIDARKKLPVSLDRLTLEGGTERYAETSSTNSYSERISRSTSKNSEDLVLSLTNKCNTLVKKTLLYLVCFLLGDSPASEFYKPTFRNTLSVPPS